MLTTKQHAFVHACLTNGFNATQAAIAAGYSAKTANREGSRLLSNVDIQKAISVFQSRLEEKTDLTVERLVKEFGHIAFSNVQDYLEEGTLIADLTRMPPDKAVALAVIEITRTEFMGTITTRTKFKLHSKIAALESLGKHLGMFEKDNRQKDPTKIIVERVRHTVQLPDGTSIEL